MQSPMKILLSAGLGAAAMYYLDPVQGRERRDIALERLEQGREGLEFAGHTARSVGHDVSKGTGRAVHGLRAFGHELGSRAGSAWDQARAVGHDVGDRAGRLTHGLREVGHGTRARAAGATASLGSLFERPHFHRHRSGRSALKLMGIPVKWLLFAGIGASVMYFFDPSQGLYRRVRFRDRFLKSPEQRMDDTGVPETGYAEQSGAHQQGRTTSSLRDEERPLPG